MCGVTVYLASVRFDPARYKDHLRQYLAIGADVARGENLPPDLPPPAEPDTAPAAPARVDPHLAAALATFLGSDWAKLTALTATPPAEEKS
jgi:hypothetical protein